MMNRLWSTVQNKFELSLILILTLTWFPLLRFGFDSHHDGLMASTLNNIKLGNDGVGNWPFNQYGPAWFLILKSITPLVSSQYFFIAARSITLCFYFLAFLLTYLVSKRFLSRRLSLITVIVIMTIQPFVSDYNSDMIPWPSAFSMALIPLAALSILRAIDRKSQKNLLVNTAIASASISLVTLSRVQIGLALLLGVLLVLIVYRRLLEAITLVIGYVVITSIFVFYFVRMQWLPDMLSDVFKFGALYVTGDKSTYPKPHWTFILSFSLVILFYVLQNSGLLRFINSHFKRIFLPILIILVTLGVVVLSARDLNSVQLISVAFRRVWISAIIAALAISFLELFSMWLKKRELPSVQYAVLVVFAIVAELQVWPLFDQMHAWWSSTPAVILGVVLTSQNKALNALAVPGRKFVYSFAGICVLAIYLITFSTTVSHERVPLKIQGYSGILISEKDGLELESVNHFLVTSLNPGNSVLNLCTNGNPFFSPDSGFPSASRVFVFWSQMTSIESMKQAITSAQPDQIVTCSFVTNPVFYKEYSDAQRSLLSTFSDNFSKSAEYLSPNNVTWTVYSRGIS